MFFPQNNCAAAVARSSPRLSDVAGIGIAPKTSHLFKQQVTEGLGKLAVLHQQEVAQSFKMSLHPQIHKEVVHHCLVHQRDAGDTKEERS